jgi:hypothetical protein
MGASISSPMVGASYESLFACAIESKIPMDVVDVQATFERYKDPKDNLIPTETVTQLRLLTDVFLAHDWEMDELNRDNHERVARINDALKSTGFITWFDAERMTGDIADQMVSGIDNALVILVFVTQQYMEKVNGLNANDSCRKEFRYAVQKRSSTKMIPVGMESRMKDIRKN